MEKKSDDRIALKIFLYSYDSWEALRENGASRECDIRRIWVDRKCSTCLQKLKTKFRESFPFLSDKKLKVQWEDEEMDWITVDTDEELAMAMAEMEGPIKKFSVSYVEGAEGADMEQTSSEVPTSSSLGREHPGVACDGCDNMVMGFRYKCLQCEDYDLCGVCEAKGIHPGHVMIRIPSPDRAWPHWLYRRISRMQERLMKRDAASTLADLGTSAGGGGGGGAGHDIPQARPFCRGRGFRGNFHGFNCRPKVFDSMIKGWTGVESGQGEDKSFHETIHKAAHDAASAAAAAAASAAASAAAVRPGAADGRDANDDNRSNFLYNLGEVVAAALDPFGVDVLVDVVTPGNERKRSDPNNVHQVKAKKEKLANKPDGGPAGGEKKDAESHASDKDEGSSEVAKEELVKKNMDVRSEVNEPVVDAEDSLSEDGDSEWMVLNRSPVQSVRDVPIKMKIDDAMKDLSLDSTSSSASHPNDNASGERQIPIRMNSQAESSSVYPKLPEKETSDPGLSVSKATDSSPEEAAKSKSAEKEEVDNGRSNDAPAEKERRLEPNIQVALQAMLNMGFTNENGWLEKLLQSKKGDIGSALDILHSN